MFRIFQNRPLIPTENTTTSIKRYAVPPSSRLPSFSTLTREKNLNKSMSRHFAAKDDEKKKNSKETEKLHGFVVSTENPFQVIKLSAFIQEETSEKQQKNRKTSESYVEWLDEYINDDMIDFLDKYDEFSRELIAEATYFTVKLGLDVAFERMSYPHVLKFKPLEEVYSWRTAKDCPWNPGRAELIEAVCEKLKKPTCSFEISYALRQAAWIVYIKENTYKTFQEEEQAYQKYLNTKKFDPR